MKQLITTKKPDQNSFTSNNPKSPEYITQKKKERKKEKRKKERT